MHLGQPSLGRLELTGLSHQTTHNCYVKIVYGVLRYSERRAEEGACQMLEVVARKNLTEQLQVQKLLVRVVKSGVEDQQEESSFLMDFHSLRCDSVSVFGVPEECQLCCAKALGKLVGLSMLL
jgi:hypothetical protein